MEMDAKCRAWMVLYIARLRKAGMDFEAAKDNYNAGCPHDLDEDPEQAADDELSYLASDG